MERERGGPGRPRLPVRSQVSAGGVVLREGESGPDVALLRVAARLQLPKGLVEPGETPLQAAVREVREEAGIEVEPLLPLEPVEYGYVGRQGGERFRFHKKVHFHLMEYRSGDVGDHDREVDEALWMPLSEALTALSFEGERRALRQAAEAWARRRGGVGG